MDTLELINWSKGFAPSWYKDFPDNYNEWRLIYFFNGKKYNRYLSETTVVLTGSALK